MYLGGGPPAPHTVEPAVVDLRRPSVLFTKAEALQLGPLPESNAQHFFFRAL